MIGSVETAVILLVPEAEPLLEDVRAKTGAATTGMPAHVTLLYPFHSAPDEGDLAELSFFFAGVDGFPLTFGAVAEFPEVVYLAPDQVAECQELTNALVRRWPAFPPYGGLFEQVVPHLTVVNTPDGAVRASARELLEGSLPLVSRAKEASLWGREPGEAWRCLQTFPLLSPEPEV